MFGYQMLKEEDLLSRITKIKDLRQECFKYLDESSKEMLTHQIIHTMARLIAEKMGPVKLSEIAQAIFDDGEKSKQDIIRLTMEKSLLKCGMVEKFRYATNDVRYALAAYRFQKIRKIESVRGDNVEPIGQVFELPKSTWPIPDEYFVLQSKKYGYQAALKKINADFDAGAIPRGTYENLILEINDKLSQTTNKMQAKFEGLEEIVGK